MLVPDLDLRRIAAPMVNQSDLPFRLLVRRYGATVPYTQMYTPDKLINDRDYLEYHLRDLSIAADDPNNRPVVAQLGGNDPNTLVQAGRKLQSFCDAIGASRLDIMQIFGRSGELSDLNLGCPQDSAREGHFGAYLLSQKDWPLIETMVSSLSTSFTVPVSAKMRLCQPVTRTIDLARRIEASGASWITLHARTVSARRRRQGAANLEVVKQLKDGLTIPVVSNGNVSSFEDLDNNQIYTRADGLMVGETLLGNPCIFAGPAIPDPVEISLEYLSICKQYPGTSLKSVQTHIRHFVEYQCSRRPWFPKFRTAVGDANSLEALEHLLSVKVERWRGRHPRRNETDNEEGIASEIEINPEGILDETGPGNDIADGAIGPLHYFQN